MDGRPTWTDCDEAGDYVVPNVLSPRDLVFRPDNMDETVPHTFVILFIKLTFDMCVIFLMFHYICTLSQICHKHVCRFRYLTHTTEHQ